MDENFEQTRDGTAEIIAAVENFLLATKSNIGRSTNATLPRLLTPSTRNFDTLTFSSTLIMTSSFCT